MRFFYKKKYNNILIGVLLVLFFASCNSPLFREECSVTGKYENYLCKEGFDTLKEAEVKNIVWINIDSCQIELKRGCATTIYSETDYYNKLVDTKFNYLDSTAFWDFNKQFVVFVAVETDYGSRAYSKVFVCENPTDSVLLIRCQYEMADQCAGSSIDNQPLAFFVSVPKLYLNYTLQIEIENVNPL